MNNYQYNSCSSQIATIKLTGAELTGVFPEARHIVPALTKELNAKRKTLVLYIGKRLSEIKTESKDEVFRYFWRLWLMLNEGEELQELDNKLARLNRLQNIIDGKPTPKGALPEGAIEAAHEYPIQDLFDSNFRRSGNNLVGLCPFHDERTPSFYIFVKQNRAHCFGCNKSLDVIDAYMELNECSFKAAVAALTGGKP
jgi:hypothetical protein